MKIFNLLLILITGTTLTAQTTDDVDNIALEILRNNNAYRTELKKIEAEGQRLKTENNLSDPEIEMSHVWGYGDAGNKLDIGVSQGFDWPGAYKAREKANKANIYALQKLAQSRCADLLYDIKIELVKASAAKYMMDYYKGVLHNIDSLMKIVGLGVDKRELSILETNKLKIERINLNSSYDDAAGAFNDAFLKLTEYNGGKSCSELLYSLSFNKTTGKLRSLESYLEDYKLNNPLNSYRSSLKEAKRLEATAIRRSNLPSFSLGITHLREDGENFTGFTAGMSLPFFSGKGKNKANQLEAEAIALEIEQEDLAGRNRICTDYDDAEKLLHQIHQYEEVLSATDYLGVVNKAFEARYININDYIQELHYYNGVMVNLMNLRNELQLKMASLDRYSKAPEAIAAN